MSELIPSAQIFSIAQVINTNPDECDFTKAFGTIDGSVAIDCTQEFDGWKLGILSVIAIKETDPHEVFDGEIVY